MSTISPKASSSPHLLNLIVLLLLWTAVQFFLYCYTGGVKVVIDSKRYLNAADFFIRNGFQFFESAYSIQYLSYVLFLSIILEAGGSLTSVVILQLTFSAVAMVALYRATFIISRSSLSSLIACLFFILWVKIQAWNFYILTESLFISFCIFSFYCMLKIRNNRKFGFLVVPVFLFTIFIRPHGIIFLLATVIYFSTLLTQTKSYAIHRKAIFGTSFIIGILLLLLTGIAIQHFDFMSVYLAGDVVYLASHYVPQFSSLSVDPEGLLLPTSSLPTMIQLVQFIFQNPVYFTQLALTKLFFFFAHIKPYYSVIHNFLIGFTLYPLYIFFTLGLTKVKDVPARNFVVGLIALQAFSVMLMVEDWDGRFLMPVLPFVMIFSAIGFVLFLHRLKTKYL